MVSSVGFQLSANRRINGFGRRRVPVTRGRGVIRNVVGNVLARPALTFIANKVADLISGSGRKVVRRRRITRGSSWKTTGTGTRRPRRRLTIRRKTTGTGIKRRAPRRSLAGIRKHRVTHRVLLC